MNEILQVSQTLFQITSFILTILLIPLMKFLVELRLRIERIETLLNVIMKDLEKLKEDLYDGDSED